MHRAGCQVAAGSGRRACGRLDPELRGHRVVDHQICCRIGTVVDNIELPIERTADDSRCGRRRLVDRQIGGVQDRGDFVISAGHHVAGLDDGDRLSNVGHAVDKHRVADVHMNCDDRCALTRCHCGAVRAHDRAETRARPRTRRVDRIENEVGRQRICHGRVGEECRQADVGDSDRVAKRPAWMNSSVDVVDLADRDRGLPDDVGSCAGNVVGRRVTHRYTAVANASWITRRIDVSDVGVRTAGSVSADPDGHGENHRGISHLQVGNREHASQCLQCCRAVGRKGDKHQTCRELIGHGHTVGCRCVTRTEVVDGDGVVKGAPTGDLRRGADRLGDRQIDGIVLIGHDAGHVLIEGQSHPTCVRHNRVGAIRGAVDGDHAIAGYGHFADGVSAHLLVLRSTLRHVEIIDRQLERTRSCRGNSVGIDVFDNRQRRRNVGIEHGARNVLAGGQLYGSGKISHNGVGSGIHADDVGLHVART